MSTEMVPLLIPRDHIELDLGKGLLEGAGIPFVVDATDRAQVLEVLAGSSAEGLHCLLVPQDRLADAVAVLEASWGPEALKGRVNLDR
jgi:hypothetical protein